MSVVSLQLTTPRLHRFDCLVLTQSHAKKVVRCAMSIVSLQLTTPRLHRFDCLVLTQSHAKKVVRHAMSIVSLHRAKIVFEKKGCDDFTRRDDSFVKC